MIDNGLLITYCVLGGICLVAILLLILTTEDKTKK